jgi:hypothetical protein
MSVTVYAASENMCFEKKVEKKGEKSCEVH